MLKKLVLALVISLVFAATSIASPYLQSDPHDQATGYVIRLLNDPVDLTDDQEFTVVAQPDGSLRADLVNFPAGDNQLMIKATNLWGQSIEVPFEFSKDMPGIPSNIALVNIDGQAWIVAAPQAYIDYYRITIDGTELIVDAQPDGSLLYSLEGIEDGVHSIEANAINMWGESNPAPFGFTKQLPSAPENLRLIQ